MRVVTQNTAKTALLTTAGHPDILVLREGGRIEPFNFSVPYPAPYVPRSLTYEISERIDSLGNIVTPLEERTVLAAIEALKRQDIEAVAVCFYGQSPTRFMSNVWANFCPRICPMCPILFPTP